ACRVDLISRDKSVKPGQTYGARAQVLGTNVPCLLEIVNRTPDVLSLSLAGDQRPLVKTRAITTGGDVNAVQVELTLLRAGDFKAVVSIVPDLPALDDEATVRDPEFATLERRLLSGEITRLKKRLISVQSRLLQAVQHLESTGRATDVSEASNANAKKTELSNRQSCLIATLKARSALLEAMRGTEADHQPAIKSATSCG